MGLEVPASKFALFALSYRRFRQVTSEALRRELVSVERPTEAQMRGFTREVLSHFLFVLQRVLGPARVLADSLALRIDDATP